MVRRSLSKVNQPRNHTANEAKLGKSDFIVSKTDTKGKITYVNQTFVQLAGYPAADLIGANHNLIRHPDMPKLAFKVAWERIRKKREFFGFVKNLCADGSFYWVYAYITADLDSSGNITGYTSIRRKPPESAINTISPIYKRLRDAESFGGVDASEKLLESLLAEQGMGYDEFIIGLQKDIRV